MDKKSLMDKYFSMRILGRGISHKDFLKAADGIEKRKVNDYWTYCASRISTMVSNNWENEDFVYVGKKIIARMTIEGEMSQWDACAE